MFDTEVKSEAYEPFKLQASPDRMASCYIGLKNESLEIPSLTVSAAASYYGFSNQFENSNTFATANSNTN
jgi:hypothetical protein